MKTYLVGGAVRDDLLHLPVTDRDWVVVGTTPAAMQKKGFRQVGGDFPVFLHPQTQEEYALARTERKSGKGYAGFDVTFSPEVTLEQDLARRDLTINAMARDDTGQLFDPFNGEQDLGARLLRHVSPAFADDPLRVLRVARFAARFYSLGFTIAPETLALMRQLVDSGELMALTTERVWLETMKALATPAPQHYFSVLQSCGALTVLFPEIAALFLVPTLSANNQQSTLGEKALSVLSHSVALTADPVLRFAIFCHDLDYSAQNSPIDTLSLRLKMAIQTRALIAAIAAHYQTVNRCLTLSLHALLTLFDETDLWRRPERLNALLICSFADHSVTTSDTVSFEDFTPKLYLEAAYQLALSVDIKPILASGATGVAIREALYQARFSLLTSWRQSLA